MPVALLITCAACLLAWNGLEALSGRGGLDQFLRFWRDRFAYLWRSSDSTNQLDLSLWSTPLYDTVIAARCFMTFMWR